MKTFKQCSNQERRLTKKYIHLYNNNITDLVFTSEDGYDKYDLSFKIDNQLYIAEVKCRDYKSSDFADWVLENYKHDNLIEIAEQLNAIPLYFNFFTDRVLSVWNINDCTSIEPTREKFNKQTAGSNNNKIRKWVRMITITKPISLLSPKQLMKLVDIEFFKEHFLI
jgi:hypothetical protein